MNDKEKIQEIRELLEKVKDITASLSEDVDITFNVGSKNKTVLFPNTKIFEVNVTATVRQEL